MNLSKNLIVALLGLGCYARSNSINLANNTTILLIILALLAKQNNEDTNIEIANTRNTNICARNNDCGTRVVYPEAYTYTDNCYTAPRNGCYYTTSIIPYQTNIPYCTPCNTSWNYPHCFGNYTSPCQHILY